MRKEGLWHLGWAEAAAGGQRQSSEPATNSGKGKYCGIRTPRFKSLVSISLSVVLNIEVRVLRLCIKALIKVCYLDIRLTFSRKRLSGFVETRHP